jgi:acyl-CoA synthetase (AMP-forming)/AMP-acid ligase II
MDRLGDTFRWRSENVSTAEVQEAMGLFPGILEANVYGVEVPGHEGRAGCAAVSLDPNVQASFDWKALAKFLKARLPKYAVPVFIRVLSGEVEDYKSHNNKQNKVPLRMEGVDPSLKGTKLPASASDQILWLPPDATGYIPFEKKDWDNVKAGTAKL